MLVELIEKYKSELRKYEQHQDDFNHGDGRSGGFYLEIEILKNVIADLEKLQEKLRDCL